MTSTQTPYAAVNKRLASGEQLARHILAGAGQLAFTANPTSGLLIVTAIFAASLDLGILFLLGLLVATLTAGLLRCERPLIETGCYGYNGGLVGLGLGCLEAPELWLAPAALVVGSALSVVLARLWFEGAPVRRWNLPALTLPSLLVTWLVLLTINAGGWGHVAPEAFTRPPLTSTELTASTAELLALLKALAPSMVLVSAAMWLHSRISVLYLWLGLVSGVGCASAAYGSYGLTQVGYILVAATPVFYALSGFFVAPRLRTIVFASAAAALAFAPWLYGARWLSSFELPILTAPFTLTTLALLVPINLAFQRQWRLAAWLPTPIPLTRVDSPQSAAHFAQEQESAQRYWHSLAPATEPSRMSTFQHRRQFGRAVDLLASCERIVALTGAGLSTESGIPDYRSGALAWQHYDASQLTWQAFVGSQEARRYYWQMSQDFFVLLRTARPNAAHFAIAELERLGKLSAVVTQNVDRLHQRAGHDPQRILELHGNEFGVSCLLCQRAYRRADVYAWIVAGNRSPYCPHCSGILKPDSVAFGQPMPTAVAERAVHAVDNANLLLVVGTSLLVQPAAGLPLRAKQAGARMIVVNLEPTPLDAIADVVIRDRAGRALPKLVSQLRKQLAVSV